MKYAGMAFQMGILLAIGAFLGKKLDQFFGMERPYITSLCLILFLFAALYTTFKDLIHTDNH
ncbi:MAG: AtpZ/AtpI family protein [Lewinellaceae bacterium]|nr:AtpZ/AtpI family protein [Saprospiraceae bacterium]MCB9340240.1 AtpZ/AtpI family protein [Lewinellaceae bacterium]